MVITDTKSTSCRVVVVIEVLSMTIAASIGNIMESEFVHQVRIGLPRVKLQLSKLDSVNGGHFSLNCWRRIKPSSFG